MSKNPSDLLAKSASLLAEMETIEATYGTDRSAWDAGIAERYDRLATGAARISAELDEAAERAAKIDAVRKAAADPRNREAAFSPRRASADLARNGRTLDPWAGLGADVARSDSTEGVVARAYDAMEALPEHVPASGREFLADVLRSDQHSLDAAAFIVAATNPAYERAFIKMMRDPVAGHRMWTGDEQLAYAAVVNASRASLADSNSGAILPLVLDPAVMYSNAGAINPVRRLAERRTTTSNTWNGAISAGATANWVAENTAFTDGTPTLTAVSSTPQKLVAWLTGSYEVFADTDAASQIPALVQESFDRAEASAFVTGSGSGSTPLGVVTALAAVTASRVSTTTASTFTSASVADLYALDNALPARSRTGRPAWLANRAVINTIRQMSATANGSSFWANLSQKVDGINAGALLLDHPIYEASAMSSTVTASTNALALVDFSQVFVVDRLATVIEYVQNVVDGSGVPTGTRGYVGYKRTTVLTPNTDAGRILRA